MATLFDANVLIALLVEDHVHHDAADQWLGSFDGSFATCPITEGSLVRLLLREGQSAQTAQTMLSALGNDPRHEFWPDISPYRDVAMTGIIGHRQVTDAYLAHLARIRPGRLATFDRGLAKLHGDVAELVPVG